MTEIDLTPHEQYITLVYNDKGEEIDRKEGGVILRPKDYEDQLPIKYRYIKVTVEILTDGRIEK